MSGMYVAKAQQPRSIIRAHLRAIMLRRAQFAGRGRQVRDRVLLHLVWLWRDRWKNIYRQEPRTGDKIRRE